MAKKASPAVVAARRLKRSVWLAAARIFAQNVNNNYLTGRSIVGTLGVVKI